MSLSVVPTQYHKLHRTITRLSREEERELIEKAQAGDEQAVERVVEQYTCLVVGFAIRWRRLIRNVDMDGLVQEGRVAIWHCIKHFDTSMNFRFITYIYRAIQNRMWRFIQGDRSITLPENKMPKYMESRKKVLVVYPLDVERTTRRGSVEHMGEPMVATVNTIAEEIDVLDEQRQELDLMMKRLKPRTREILEARMRGATLTELGVVYGVCKERIRQIVEKAIKDMQRMREGNEA